MGALCLALPDASWAMTLALCLLDWRSITLWSTDFLGHLMSFRACIFFRVSFSYTLTLAR